MQPYLSENDIAMFYKYLDKTHVYFEYGCGGSTYQASLRDTITKIYSVESDKEWQEKLKSTIQKTNIVYLFNDMDTQPKTWGHPGKRSSLEQRKNYSNQLSKLSKDEREAIDFLFIDGRFRVACCLKAYALLKKDCFIGFDDFLNRSQYHIVLDYFDIVEKTSDEKMVILQKKEGMSIPQQLLEKYELIKE